MQSRGGRGERNDDDRLRYSIVRYFGLSESESDCGYCKQQRGPGETYGLWAYHLEPQHYQMMIDRNWRRCGHYVYRAVNEKICCPMYTIRCDAENFRPSRSQRRVLKNFNAYIRDDRKDRQKINRYSSKSNDIDESYRLLQAAEQWIETKSFDEEMLIENQNFEPIVSNRTNVSIQKDSHHCSERLSDGLTEESFRIIPENQNRTIKKESMKKKFRRRIRLEDKLMKREHCSREEARKILLERSKSKQPGTKTLEDYLDEISESKQKETKHSFRTRFVRFDSDSNETKLLMRESFDVYRKYQSKIHKESEDEISLKSYRRFLIDGPLEVSSSFSLFDE